MTQTNSRMTKKKIHVCTIIVIFTHHLDVAGQPGDPPLAAIGGHVHSDRLEREVVLGEAGERRGHARVAEVNSYRPLRKVSTQVRVVDEQTDNRGTGARTGV